MGIFSFGGSKSRTKSSGQSSSINFSDAGSESGGFSAGGSGSVSASSSIGQAVGGSTSDQRVAFEDVFARLFGGAEGAAAGLDPSMLTEVSNQLFSGGVGFMDQLTGGADTDFLESRISGDDGLLEEQISELGEDIGSFFREQILPGITSEAIAGGSLGGGRQGVAEGAAADTAGREFRRGSTALRTGDAANRTEAAGMLGRTRIDSAATGLSSLGQVAGIADIGFGAELEPFERLSALLGGPTVLGASSSSNVSSSIARSDTESNAFNNAEDFARSFSSSFGQSQASNKSSGRSNAVSFGSG